MLQFPDQYLILEIENWSRTNCKFNEIGGAGQSLKFQQENEPSRADRSTDDGRPGCEIDSVTKKWVKLE